MATTIGAWLKTQTPDVWHATADHLNWDNSEHVVKWIVSQPNCDKATAAKLFWLANPGYFGCALARGEEIPKWASSGWAIVQTVLKNWKRGFYVRSELGWTDSERKACIATYERDVAGVDGAATALDIPEELFGPFTGREPVVPPVADPRVSAQVWDFLDRQGTHVGFRPGSEQWHAADRASKPPRRGFWSKLFG